MPEDGVLESCLRSRDGSPSEGRITPAWGAYFGDAVVHPDLPADEVDEAVMEPAEQHTIVGVGRPAVDMLENMMDFTPSGRHTTAGDDAPAVPEGDRAALVPVEHALLNADADDASVVAGRDPLDGTGTPDV